MKNSIISYCKIDSQKVVLNGEIIHKIKKTDNPLSMLTHLYKTFDGKYPKFFKMDALSKLAVVSTHLLLKNTPFINQEYHNDCAIIINNSSSSLAVDKQYQQTINEFPSPSLFVYTLPNVMLGELCIRYKIFGENIVFLSENFDIEQLTMLINTTYHSSKITHFIAGYIEQNEQKNESFLMLIDKNEK